MVNGKNNETNHIPESCPQTDGFFVGKQNRFPLMETEDGSFTVLGPLGETYHSVAGAVLESQYVYIDCGLHYFIEKKQTAGTLPSKIHILEMGLGTGLNAFLTCRDFLTCRELLTEPEIFYRAIDKYPLPSDLADRLHYATNPQEIACFQGIHSDTWDTPYRITDRFTLLKHRCDLLDFNPVGKPPVHVVFYDAFSPAAQPELWTEQALQRIVPLLAPEAVLTTYSCKGTFRRLLESLGFTTERLPGPGKKRHILRAVFTTPQI